MPILWWRWDTFLPVLPVETRPRARWQGPYAIEIGIDNLSQDPTMHFKGQQGLSHEWKDLQERYFFTFYKFQWKPLLSLNATLEGRNEIPVS